MLVLQPEWMSLLLVRRVVKIADGLLRCTTSDVNTSVIHKKWRMYKPHSPLLANSKAV